MQCFPFSILVVRLAVRVSKGARTSNNQQRERVMPRTVSRRTVSAESPSEALARTMLAGPPRNVRASTELLPSASIAFIRIKLEFKVNGCSRCLHFQASCSFVAANGCLMRLNLNSRIRRVLDRMQIDQKFKVNGKLQQRPDTRLARGRVVERFSLGILKDLGSQVGIPVERLIAFRVYSQHDLVVERSLRLWGSTIDADEKYSRNTREMPLAVTRMKFLYRPLDGLLT